MIIREHDDDLIMIEQDYHAHLSEDIISHWKNIFLQDDPYVDSVLHAIKYHDYGWKTFDKQPFLNDETNLPYSFIDFPLGPKTILYTDGVDKVQQVDPYAAALCSAHYMSFMENNSSPIAKKYYLQEEKRKDRILADFSMSKNQFEKHLAILQFADNISLYLCLNEPGTNQDNVHYFFKKGIKISPKINQINTEHIQAKWLDHETVSLQGLPSVPNFSVTFKQKQLNKDKIKQDGLMNHYQARAYEEMKVDVHIN